MRARERPLFLIKGQFFESFFFGFPQSNGKKGNSETDISALKSVFGFRVRYQIRNPNFNLNPDFPIERTLKCYNHFLYYIDFMANLLLVLLVVLKVMFHETIRNEDS